MALRFRRTLKIAPGIRLNLGKRGASVSVGGRGLSINIGRRGTFLNVGAPGTGLSYRTKLNNSAKDLGSGARRPKSAQNISTLNLPSSVSMALNEELELILTDGTTNTPLSDDQRAAFLTDNKDRVHAWLQQQANKSNAEIFALAEFHRTINWDDAETFGLELPDHPSRPDASLPEPPALPSSINAGRGVPWIRRNSEDKYRRDLADYQQKHTTWLQARRVAMDQQGDAWRRYRKALSALQTKRQETYQRLASDPEFVLDVLRKRVESLDWPRETEVRFQIDDAVKRVMADVELPEIDDMPNKRFQTCIDPHGLDLADLSSVEVAALHGDHILSVCASIAASVFVAVPHVAMVVVNGYTESARDNDNHAMDKGYIVKFELSRDLYMTDLRPRLRQPRLTKLAKQPWCRMSFDGREN